jgi:hypothetical protein
MDLVDDPPSAAAGVHELVALEPAALPPLVAMVLEDA